MHCLSGKTLLTAATTLIIVAVSFMAVFSYYQNRYGRIRKALLQSTLWDTGITIGDNPSYVLTDRHKELLKEAYKDFSVEETYGIDLTTRYVYCP